MKVNLIAIGTKMPNWINEGFATYAKRLPHSLQLHLIEVEGPKHHKNGSISQWMEQEAERLLAAVPANNVIIALDRQGKAINSGGLAETLQEHQDSGRDISLLVGGPEGLAESCLKQANRIWSLSDLTLPHALVRVVVAEQIYRAWSIMSRHPYHR